MNPRMRPLIAGVVGLVVAILVVVVLVLPEMNRVRSQNDALSAAEQQHTQLQVQLSQLQADEQQAPETRKQLAKVNGQIPPSTDLPGLIRLLNNAADQAGVDFLSIGPGQPTAPTTGPAVSSIPITLTVKGGFWSVDEFLFRLENLPRLSVIGTSSFTRVLPTVGQVGASTIQGTISVTFFTTDVSAGPGSQPGSQTQTSAGAGGATPSPTPTPSPSAS